MLPSLAKAARHYRFQKLITRTFAVKELSWCTPKTNLKKKNEWSNDSSVEVCKTCVSIQDRDSSSSKEAAPFFGIIAAMNQNRVIGVDGKLPWNIPEDRSHFENITSGKTLIMGRKTFLEQGMDNFSHINHCQDVIIVSQTLSNDDICLFGRKTKSKLHLAGSFDEAIQLSSSFPIESTTQNESKANHESIHCWIGGGQRIYEEALRHPDALEIHLTIVQDMNFDQKEFYTQLKESKVSFFPAKYRYDNTFDKVDEKGGKEIENKRYSCCFQTFRRKKKKI